MSVERNKEKPTPSLEEITPAVKKMFDLEEAKRALGWAVNKREFYVYPRDVDKTRTDYSINRKNWEALRKFPELRGLVEEEDSMFAGGASPQEVQKLSNLYERAYKRYEEIGRQLDELREQPLVYDVALSLWLDNHGKTWDEIDKGALRDVYEQKVKGVEDLAEYREYWDLERGVENAIQGIRSRELLAREERRAKELGFPSAEAMWAADVEKMRAFNVRILGFGIPSPSGEGFSMIVWEYGTKVSKILSWSV